MQTHSPLREQLLNYTDMLLTMESVAPDTDPLLPLGISERYGYSSSLPGLDDAWARYYPAIDLLAAQTNPRLLPGNTMPDERSDSEEFLEELRAHGWEVDDIREVPLVRKPPNMAVHNARAHELAHVNLHKLSWWWMKIALTNCHANMLFYNVLHTFQYRQSDLVDDVTDLLAFEWNSRRLLYAVLPLQEAVATIVGAVHATEDTIANIEQAIKKRKLQLELFTKEKKKLAALTAVLEDERQAVARRALREALQADKPLEWCPISLKEVFPTLSITNIEENKREWRICQAYYELQVLTAAKTLFEVFDDDRVVKMFISHLAVAASDSLSSSATAPVPPSIIPPSNRFLEALDVAASHPHYYQRAHRLEEPANTGDALSQLFKQSYGEAHRLLSRLGLTPLGIPLITGPLKQLTERQGMENHIQDNKFHTAVFQQLDVAKDRPNPLFTLLVDEGTSNVRLWLPEGCTLQDVDYCALNYWMTVLRWLFIESLEQKENKMDSPLLDKLQPVDATDCIESAVGTFTELKQNDQLDLVIEQSRNKLHSLAVPSHADPLVP